MDNRFGPPPREISPREIEQHEHHHNEGVRNVERAVGGVALFAWIANIFSFNRQPPVPQRVLPEEYEPPMNSQSDLSPVISGRVVSGNDRPMPTTSAAAMQAAFPPQDKEAALQSAFEQYAATHSGVMTPEQRMVIDQGRQYAKTHPAPVTPYSLQASPYDAPDETASPERKEGIARIAQIIANKNVEDGNITPEQNRMLMQNPAVREQYNAMATSIYDHPDQRAIYLGNDEQRQQILGARAATEISNVGVQMGAVGGMNGDQRFAAAFSMVGAQIDVALGRRAPIEHHYEPPMHGVIHHFPGNEFDFGNRPHAMPPGVVIGVGPHGRTSVSADISIVPGVDIHVNTGQPSHGLYEVPHPVGHPRHRG